MPMGLGYGAAQGLEQVLARQFQQALEAQRVKEQAKAFALQQRGQDLSRLGAEELHERGMGQLGVSRQNADVAAGNLDVRRGEFGLRGNEFEQRVREYDEAAPARAANLRFTEAQTGRLENPPDQYFTVPQGSSVASRNTGRITAQAPVAGVGGGAPGSAVSQLGPGGDLMLRAVMENPFLFEGMSPTAKQNMIPILQASGFDFAAAAEGGLTPSMGAGVKRLESSMNILTDLDQFLTQREGMGGRLEGWTQTGYARLTGEQDPVVLYDGVASALLPALARSSGEVGNLAEQEQVRYARLQPKASDPINVRQAKYAAIQYIVDSARSGATSDEMRPFLDYMALAGGGDPATPTSSPEGQGTGPQVGERRRFGSEVGVWNGSAWVAE